MAALMRHELNMQQKQGLALTPALAQSLHILTLPVLELAEYVRGQVEENPALELGEEENPGEEAPLAPEHDLAYDETAYEEDWQRFLAEEPDPYVTPPPRREGFSPVLPAREEQSLFSLLRLQLALSEAPAEQKQAAEQIIGHLDEDGYLSISLSRLAELCGFTEASLTAALSLVQGLEPPGVAARSLRECLCLQIGAEEPERPLIITVIEKYLENVAANRVRETARDLKIPVEQVEAVFRRIRALHPKPAAGLGGGTADTQYIVPDIIVKKIYDEYQVFLNDHLEPRLHISAYYRQPDPLLRADAEAAQYIKQKLSAAQSLIRNIERRRQTVYRLAQIVMREQRAFLEQGLPHLAPLTMRAVADQAELHESTVSRAIAGKYIQTPRGVYPWKFFFPRAFGELIPAWVKAQLAELILGEDKTKPFSDQRLSELLAERGAVLARRTVTKYREELGIETKSKRTRGDL